MILICQLCVPLVPSQHQSGRIYEASLIGERQGASEVCDKATNTNDICNMENENLILLVFNCSFCFIVFTLINEMEKRSNMLIMTIINILNISSFVAWMQMLRQTNFILYFPICHRSGKVSSATAISCPNRTKLSPNLLYESWQCNNICHDLNADFPISSLHLLSDFALQCRLSLEG